MKWNVCFGIPRKRFRDKRTYLFFFPVCATINAIVDAAISRARISLPGYAVQCTVYTYLPAEIQRILEIFCYRDTNIANYFLSTFN